MAVAWLLHWTRKDSFRAGGRLGREWGRRGPRGGGGFPGEEEGSRGEGVSPGRRGVPGEEGVFRGRRGVWGGGGSLGSGVPVEEEGPGGGGVPGVEGPGAHSLAAAVSCRTPRLAAQESGHRPPPRGSPCGVTEPCACVTCGVRELYLRKASKTSAVSPRKGLPLLADWPGRSLMPPSLSSVASRARGDWPPRGRSTELAEALPSARPSPVPGGRFGVRAHGRWVFGRSRSWKFPTIFRPR